MASDSYRRDAIRIKAVRVEDSKVVNEKKFCVDPTLTTLEVLLSILIKAFEIKGDFTVKYLVKDDYEQEMYLNLINEFDLDAAFARASEPALNLQIEGKPMTYACDDWESVDVAEVATQALPAESWIPAPPRLSGLLLHTMVEKSFNILKGALSFVEETPAPVINLQPPREPLTDEEFRKFLCPVGEVVKSNELRRLIYLGGVEPILRKVVWKHLLNVYPEGMTGKERMDYMKRKSNEYHMLRDAWKEMLKNGEMVGDLAYVTGMVRKDVLRTDRHHAYYAGSDDNKNVVSLYNILTTYALNHPQVSYCQGMSDLASPLLVTMDNEAHAYICFCALMRRLSPNFLLDGITMTQRFQHLSDGLLHYDPVFHAYLKSHQADDLLFCYRWLLLEMKREFAFEDALRMLEVMWSSLPPAFPIGELKLFDKEFRLPSELPPPSPRENAYTKVCALRRQTSASIPVSLNSVDESSIVKRRTAPFIKQTKKKQFLSMDDFSNSSSAVAQNSNKFSAQETGASSLSSPSDKNRFLPSPSKINLDFKNKLGESKTKCMKLFSSLDIGNKSLDKMTNNLKLDNTASEENTQTSGKVIKNLNEFLSLDRSNSFKDDNRIGMKKQNNVEGQEKLGSDSGTTDDSSPDDFPIETVLTREIKNEAENLDKHVLGIYSNETRYSSSTDSDDDIIDNDDEDEDDLSKSPSRSDNVFFWENPIRRNSNDGLESESSYSEINPVTYEKNIEVNNKNFQSSKENSSLPRRISQVMVVPQMAVPMIPVSHNAVKNGLNPRLETQMASATTVSHSVVTNGLANSYASLDNSNVSVAKKFNGLPSPREFGGGNPFLMFLCITILCQHRDRIMRANMDCNEVAMHFDKMVRKHNVNKVLNQARIMYEEYRKQFNNLDPSNSLSV